MQFFQRKSPFINLIKLYILVNFILRLALVFHPLTQSHFSAFDITKVFFIGFFSDIFIFIIASSFLWLYLLFLSNMKYEKPYGYIIFGLLLSLLLYVKFADTILNEYGGSLPEIAFYFIGIKTLFFGLLLFFPKYRSKIRLVLFSITIFIFCLIIIQNAVSEYFFWNEFGLRYNFIAVDYLVYTNTVIGNIMESYPVIPLFIGIGAITLICSFVVIQKSKVFLESLPSFSSKIKNLGIYVVLFLVSIVGIQKLEKLQNSSNVFTNELQANGFYKFYLAFMNSELDYNKFYKTIPENEAYAILKQQIPTIIGQSSLHKITAEVAENHKNVVLITIESYSAEYLKAYGNKENLTPFIDSLATKSLLFTNLYAVGNRTVRGLEAVTLSLPPSAAESVVKKEDNKNKFSTGSLFKQRNYNVKYLYGGDAFFDNMQNFFGGNDYDIVDKNSFTPNEITFSNVWGVCDEDMYNKAIKVMNAETKENKPFFNHIMTVSNHRPFTYPDGKIKIGYPKCREGAVKYTDYALKQFFAMAKKQSWYKNTVFVILADHCASSSGKTELPLDGYRIPAMIFSEGFVKPQHFNKLMSQIDVMPTLFGMLNFSYESKFYGQDVFKLDYKPRAFIATYQDLGLIKDNVLTILSPTKKVKQFKLTLKYKKGVAPEFQIYYDEKLMKTPRINLINETISYYQTSAELLKTKQLNK